MNIRKTIPVLAAALIISAAMLIPAMPAFAAAEEASVTAPSALNYPPPGPPAPYPYPSPYYPPVTPVTPSYPYYDPHVWPYCGDNCRWYVKPAVVQPVIVQPVVVQQTCCVPQPAICCVQQPVINSFTANPSCIQQPCGSSVLSWTTTNATSVTISPGIGSVTTSGVYTVTPAATTTYTLIATSSAGSASASTTVTVNPVVTTTYSTSSSPTSTTTVSTGGLNLGESTPAMNLWLMYMMLFALLAAAAGVIIFLVSRRPNAAPAAASAAPVSRTGYMAASTGTATSTGTTPRTTAMGTGIPGRLITPEGHIIALPDSEQVLGRHDFKQMLSKDKADLISRNHVSITCKDGKYYMEDLDSTNGTKLNGSSIKGKGRCDVKDGDEIDLANVITMKLSV